MSDGAMSIRNCEGRESGVTHGDEPEKRCSSKRSRAGDLWKEIATSQCLEDGLDENLRMPRRPSKRRSEDSAESEFSKRMKRITAEHSLPSLTDVSHRCPRDMAAYRCRWVDALRSAGRLQLSVPRLKVPVHLPALTTATSSDKELLAQEIAWNICEEKIDVVFGAVEALGPELMVKVYNQTRDVEAMGGMPTVRDNRRRTPGGVFMTLLKTAVPEGLQDAFKNICREDSKVTKKIILDQKFRAVVMAMAGHRVERKIQSISDPPLSSRTEALLKGAQTVNSEERPNYDDRVQADLLNNESNEANELETGGEDGEFELDLGHGIADELTDL